MRLLRRSVIVLVLLLCAVGMTLPARDAPKIEQRFEAPNAVHWMGTDELGRDLATRGLRAMARSVIAAAAAWAMALVIGVLVGGFGGLREGTFSGRVIEAAITVAYTTPLLLLLVGAMSLAGRGLAVAYAIVVLVAWAPVARHTRAIVRDTERSSFVLAARAMGFSEFGLVRHILLPVTYRPVLIAALAVFPELIAIDAALSFFGYGPPPPTPTMGTMIIDGLQHVSHAFWIVAWPVALLMVTCLAVRLIVQPLE